MNLTAPSVPRCLSGYALTKPAHTRRVFCDGPGRKIITIDEKLLFIDDFFVEKISVNNNIKLYPSFRKVNMTPNMLSAPQKKRSLLCLGMEIMLLLSLATLPVVCIFWLFLPFHVVTEDGQLLEGVWDIRECTLFILDSLVVFLVLLRMQFFVKGVRYGELFSLKQVRNIRHAGLILVSGYGLGLAVRTLAEPLSGFDTLILISMELDSLLQLLTGSGLLALSSIFEQGRVLHDEQELVI